MKWIKTVIWEFSRFEVSGCFWPNRREMIGMKFSQKLEFASVGLNWTVGDVM